MRFGGSSRRPFLTPENKGMGNLANKRLEHTVAAANTQHEQALRVDGVPTIFWRRASPAGRVCSCSLCNNPISGAHDDTDDDIVLFDISSTDGQLSDYEILGTATKEPHKGSIFKSAQVDRKDSSLISSTQINDDQWIFEGGHETESRYKLGDNDEGNEDPFQDADIPFSIEGKIASPASGPALKGDAIKCPVCVGAGYVDSWSPHGGYRHVMAFLDDDVYSTNGNLKINTRPNILTLEPGEYLEFTVGLPAYTVALLECRLYDYRDRLEGLTVETGPGVYLPASEAEVLDKVGDETVSVKFRYVAESKVSITHFEMIGLLSDLTCTQFPTITIPYEREFVEFNTTASVEVGASVPVKPGEIVCDYKHKRTWRVTTSAPKLTAEGRTLFNTVELRLVHSLEVYAALNVFEKADDYGSSFYRRVNEKWQGQ
jgi:hypothetical protein